MRNLVATTILTCALVSPAAAARPAQPACGDSAAGRAVTTAVLRDARAGDERSARDLAVCLLQLTDATDAKRGWFWDRIVCPFLSALSPGTPGVIDINAEGDTWVLSFTIVYDCPPYNT